MTDKISLTELQQIIRDSLYLSLPQMFWVVAEISELTVNSTGHCYLELIEKNPDEKNIRARIRGIIWNNRFSFIRSFFENMTGENLRGGIKILVKAKVDYHELYGLSLVISDIDPAFTLGEMAMKRHLIIKRLEEEGVFTMNREIDFPILPQRIAIISSKNAAGYTDFINHLKSNSYGFAFYTYLIETPMQGNETEQGVISALDRIATYSYLFDLVVIIRGGGSQTDLSWFDNYSIAYHITQFPLPVVTGIGHEKNMSVTDMVANRSLKTPTAVADNLIEGMAAAENKLVEMSAGFRDLTRLILEENKNMIGTYGIKLLPVARLMISETREKLSGKILELTRIGSERTFRSGLVTANQLSKLFSTARSFMNTKTNSLELSGQNLKVFAVNSLITNKNRLEILEKSLNILNPDNVLRRGYTITSVNGKILRNCVLINKGDTIDTRFTDGSVSSKVIGKKSARGKDK